MSYQRIDYHRRVDIPYHVVPGIEPEQYVGPGDVVSGALGWWGLRAYSEATKETAAVRIRRASDNAEQDFETLSDGTLDRASIQTFLASTTGVFVTFYDQSGALRNLTQATAANQAAVNLSGIGSLITADFNSSSPHRYNATSALSQAQPLTYSIAAKSTNTGAQMTLFGDAGVGCLFGYRSGADNTAFLYSGSTVTATCSDGNFHSIQAVFNGASSDLNVDGTTNAVNPGTTSVSGALGLGHTGNSQHFNGQWTEAGIWAGAFTGTQSTNLDANQSAFWGY